MTSPTGILTSQIGYEWGDPIRIIARGPRELLNESARFIVRQNEREVSRGAVELWGEKWGDCWWVADASGLEAGVYTLAISDGATTLQSDVFEVGEDILWCKSWRIVALEQAERRAVFAMNKIGWQDCGMPWQEANSHAAYILGFCDLLEFARARLSDEEIAGIQAQIRNGCDYLALLQDRARELNLGDGALSHQTPKYEEVVLPSDVALAIVAWARAARLISGQSDYAERARDAWTWLQNAAPFNANFSAFNHGTPPDFEPPAQWRTRERLMQMWGALELHQLGQLDLQPCLDLAQQVMARQVPRGQNAAGLYGHFALFDDCEISEKAWTHHIENGGMSGDTGGHFPHWVWPFLQLCRSYPAHEEAARWRQTLRDFAYGYFLPACRANPFLILPLGLFGEELLWFAGSWHGMNAIYGLAARLALEFAEFFDDTDFRAIATGNAQWIAGLNVGITRKNLEFCQMFNADIAEGIALPCSQIFGVGARWAGSWTTIRGSIPNGFSAGHTFRFDVEPTLANDAPSAFTDEDWISHAGGWLSFLARLTP